MHSLQCRLGSPGQSFWTMARTFLAGKDSGYGELRGRDCAFAQTCSRPDDNLILLRAMQVAAGAAPLATRPTTQR